MSEISKKEKELLLKRQARAMELRAEFQKQVSNPFRHASGEGGAVVSTWLIFNLYWLYHHLAKTMIY